MTEFALQQRLIDFIGVLSEETGIERKEIFKVANRLEYGRLPGSSEAAEFLRQAKEDTKAGKHRPAEEMLADMRRAIDKYR